MIFLGLLSLFAFLGASESATLTVTYNVTDGGVTTSQTFYITLDDFQKVLKNIKTVTDTPPASQEKTDVAKAVTALQTVIPKLTANTSKEQKEIDLKTFRDALLALLQALYKSTDPKLQDILKKLLTSILTMPTPVPVPNPALPNLSTINLQIAQLNNLLTDLKTLQTGTDKTIATIATNIIKKIDSLKTSTDPWTLLVQILNEALSMYQLSANNPAARKIAENIISIIKQALANLPASMSGMNGLPALLISILVDLATSGIMDPNLAYNTIASLTGSGKNILKNLIIALDQIIVAVTKGLPEPLNSLFDELEDDLLDFADGAKNVPAILAVLGKLVTAVTGYTGTNKNQLVSLMGIILAVLKPLLGNVTATNAELDRLLALLNAKQPVVPETPTVPSTTCTGELVQSLLCTVGNLLVGLTGGGGGNNAGAPAGTDAAPPSTGLGGLLTGILNGVGQLLG